MGELPAEGWMVVGTIVGAAVWVMLHVVAVMLREDTRLREHQSEVQRLRSMYAKRLKELEEMGPMALEDEDLQEGEFDLVEPAAKAA